MCLFNKDEIRYCVTCWFSLNKKLFPKIKTCVCQPHSVPNENYPLSLMQVAVWMNDNDSNGNNRSWKEITLLIENKAVWAAVWQLLCKVCRLLASGGTDCDCSDGASSCGDIQHLSPDFSLSCLPAGVRSASGATHTCTGSKRIH